MKKFAFAAAAAATLIATPALAATDSTTISGDIAPVCTIDGPEDTAALDLTIGGGSQSLGNVRIQCNNQAGYVASATSQQSGHLTNGTRSAAALSYTLDTDRFGSLSLASSQVLSVAPGNQESVTGYDIAVGISVTGNTNGNPVFAGRYSDVITWSITAN